jgi:UDP-GlcNAc3NAcA epimerase
MKIITLLGARPQFIKAASLSNLLVISGINEIIVHTGQHFDKDMSEVFFNELDLPIPKYNLSVGQFSPAKQISIIVDKLEDILLSEKPDYLIVYGDTTSTIAGAITASKTFTPIIHIEAGLRSYNNKMPEEINRVATDHLSSILFCPTKQSIINLEKENIRSNVHLVGDVMYDFITRNSQKINDKFSFEKIVYDNKISEIHLDLKSIHNYYFCTIHRAENTNGDANIKIIFDALNSLNYPVIIPLHPRTLKLVNFFYKDYKNLIFLKPLSYFDNLKMIKHSLMVITDSGGIQKESFYLNKLCTTLRDQTEWVETLEFSNNLLSTINKQDIITKVQRKMEFVIDKNNDLLIDNASQKIIDIILKRK